MVRNDTKRLSTYRSPNPVISPPPTPTVHSNEALLQITRQLGTGQPSLDSNLMRQTKVRAKQLIQDKRKRDDIIGDMTLSLTEKDKNKVKKSKKHRTHSATDKRSTDSRGQKRPRAQSAEVSLRGRPRHGADGGH